MIVDNSNIRGITAFESENDTPLIIDSDRVEALPPPFECLESVSRRHPQVAQLRGIVQVQDFAARRAQKLGGKRARLFGPAVVKKAFGNLSVGGASRLRPTWILAAHGF
ncbi:MAG TPA: hypothetical protein VFP37_11140 [Steroidobacteraceae bacterium]|nr:hypothetical protein [Steroidobacteraceae bacterium]